MKPLVSVIIVNWNGLRHLQDCLDSLKVQSFKDFEVVLVDNGSTDGSLDFVRESYAWVKLVLLEENTGFATANNHGLVQAVGNYIVTLNNDTTVAEDWLEKLVNVADAHPDAGMIGCRISSYSKPDIIDSVGMGICRDAMSRGHYRNKNWSELVLPEVVEILFPSACAALYKRDMINKIGFFDADFFAYAEDTDLGIRARLAGWQAVLATRAVVYHKYSQTGGSLSPFKVYLVERNHYWVALKNFPLCSLLAVPYFTVLRYLEQMRIVLFGGGTGSEFRAGGCQRAIIIALLKAVVASIAGIPKMLRKRRQIMKLRRLSEHEFLKLLRRHQITFKELLDND